MNTIKLNFKVCKLVFKHIPVYVLFSILYTFINAGHTIIDLYIIEGVISLLEVDSTTFIEALTFILWTVSLEIFLLILRDIYSRYIKTRYRNIWVKKIQRIIYKKAMTIDISYFDDPKLYDVFSRALKQSDIKSIDCFDSTIHLIASFLNIIALVAYMLESAPILFVITIITSVFAYLCYLQISKINYKTYKDVESIYRNENYIKRTFYLEKNACDIKTTKMANLLIDKTKDIYEAQDKILRKSERKAGKWRRGEDCIYQIVTNFVIYVYLMYKLFKKAITVGKFSALISAVLRFISRFYNLSYNISRINDNALYVQDFFWLLDYEPDIEKLDSSSEIKGFEKLEIRNLSFKYPNQENYSLERINIKIKKGEKIAIIGYNGAGKTTLTKLLLKLYNPESGEILINDIDYSSLSARQIREECAIIMQDFKIYCTTIIENILMRKIETADDILICKEALKKADLDNFVNKLPAGINTILTKEFSNDGIELSGGEKQKLAIARLFASKAPFAILDEPTSALDPIAEKEINDRIMKMSDEKTIIIISHRLSTIVNADRIIMMDNGKIIESGTHEELMKMHQKYYEMFNAQAHLYKK